MNLKQTQLHILHESEDLGKRAKTGVSLHCHTENSKEMLDFVPHYANKLPIISFFWNRERENFKKREGHYPDFSTAFWEPPMSSHDVYKIEQNQLNNVGLEGIVSITDHDSVDSNIELIENNHDAKKSPISLEWTVPFEFGFFHVGVHNLPKSRAQEITKILTDFSFNGDKEPNKNRLHELFEMLNEMRGVLLVLNHPLWDIEIVGKEKHLILLKRFLKECGKWLHALEVNGFRAWSENKRVIELAEALDFPLTTGGDRHGCQANTVINLTNGNSFDEFVEEIRIDKKSQVVLLPEHKQPLHWRQLQSFAEILSDYPELPKERRRWINRIHFDTGDEKGLIPLSEHGWDKSGPVWLRTAVWTLGFLGSPAMRPLFSLIRSKKDRVPKNIEKTKFDTPDLQENSRTISNSPSSAGSAG